MPDEAEVIETAAPEPKPLALLAKERFGRNYHGEVPAPVDPEIKDESPGESKIIEDDQDDSLPEVVDESGEDNEVNPDDEPDGDPITSLADLTASLREMDLDIDDDFFNGLTITEQVNGKPVEFKISDLKATAQKVAAADDILAAAKEKRAAAARENEQKEQYLLTQYEQTLAMIGKAEQMLTAEVNSVDWATLKTEDPAQYSIKRAEMEDRAKEIQQTKMEAARSAQNWQAQQKRERDIALAEQLEVEHQRLLDKLPEWRSEKVAGDERQRIVSYLTTDDVGFSTDELQHAADHRLIVIARKAMLYDEQQGKVKVTEKKLKSIPKVMKPGSKQDGGQVSKKKVDSLRARLRNSKSTRDSLAIAMELRKEQLKQK